MAARYRNSPEQFGSVAKGIHWLTAAGMLIVYVSVYATYLLSTDQDPLRRDLLKYHTGVGLILGLLIVVRLYWVMVNVRPADEAGSQLQRLSAKAAHWFLYVLMIAMPLTGWLASKTDKVYGPIKVVVFKNTSLYDSWVTRGLGMDWNAFETSVDWFHQNIGLYVLLPLILVHAGAALYHHYVVRDRTLARMLF